MPDALIDGDGGRFCFSVHQYGCVAARCLDNGATGRVSAVFDGSFYIELDKGIACIGGAGLAASPLTLVTTAPATINWRACGVRVGAKIGVGATDLRIGERFRFRLADAIEWAPDPAPIDWTPADLERGLQAFRDACVGHVPSEGLGTFVHRHPGPFQDDSVCKHAEPHIGRLSDWLVEAIGRSGDAPTINPALIDPVIGLGPGLTPSGDDFIGGMMIALRGLGETEPCGRLWAAARTGVIKAGNPIASAHLRAASRGLGSMAIHDALAAILRGRVEKIRAAIRGIDRIGHTSGWDAIAGMIQVLQAWLQSKPYPNR